MCLLEFESDHPNLITRKRENCDVKKNTSSFVLLHNPKLTIEMVPQVFRDLWFNRIFSAKWTKVSSQYTTVTWVNNKSETRSTSFPAIACLINHQITSIPSNRCVHSYVRNFHSGSPLPLPPIYAEIYESYRNF